MPSPNRFAPITAVEIASAGKNISHGAVCRYWPLADHQAPVGLGRLDADADETERRREQDRERQSDRKLDDDRPERVRQQLTRDHPECRFAADFRRLDELEVLQSSVTLRSTRVERGMNTIMIAMITLTGSVPATT